MPTPRIIRPLFADWLAALAQGVLARAIMEVLGHGEIGVAMNTYAHVLPQLRQEAADAMDELFGHPRDRITSERKADSRQRTRPYQ
jgi:integrase